MVQDRRLASSCVLNRVPLWVQYGPRAAACGDGGDAFLVGNEQGLIPRLVAEAHRKIPLASIIIILSCSKLQRRVELIARRTCKGFELRVVPPVRGFEAAEAHLYTLSRAPAHVLRRRQGDCLVDLVCQNLAHPTHHLRPVQIVDSDRGR